MCLLSGLLERDLRETITQSGTINKFNKIKMITHYIKRFDSHADSLSQQ